jgi:aminoglycoside phosphotransferase
MIIQSGEQIEPGWLSSALKAKGALEQGEVTQIKCDAESFNKGFVSNIARLMVEYSDDAVGALPRQLFLKMSKPGIHVEYLNAGRHEIEFYQAMARYAHQVPLAACYDAQYDAATGESHLIMADLSETHFQRPQPIPPSNRHCEMIVDSLARLHAFWWAHPELGSTLGERLSAEQAANSLQRLEGTLPQFFDYLGDALLPAQRARYEQVLSSSFMRRRTERLQNLEQVTLIHGDAHTGNLMLPHDTEQGEVVLIDWHLWQIDTAAIDLAFLMALHWNPVRRAALEAHLLRHYHAQLNANGVDYSWEALWRDYREAVVIMMLIPIGQFRRNSPPGVIWFGLQDSLAAFEDLNCVEILD